MAEDNDSTNTGKHTEQAGGPAVIGRRTVSASRIVNASASTIYDLLADPSQHPGLDGSGSVVAPRPGNPTRLVLGDKFYMSMHIGVSYKIYNNVIVADENRHIAWGHSRHYWHWELEPVEGGTRVTETWDYSGLGPMAFVMDVAGFTKRNREGINRTLDGLVARFAAR